MKKKLLIWSGTLLASAAIAATVTLGWTPSTSPNIASQTLYVGVAAGIYTNQIILPASTVQYQVLNLITGATYHFALTAMASNGLVSPFSSESVYTVPIPPPPTNTAPSAPQNLHVTGQ